MKNLARAGLAALTLTTLMGANEGGCGQGLDNRPNQPGVDVGGTAGASWQVSYGGQMEVTVKGGAGTVMSKKMITVAQGGSFEVAGISVDVKAMCARGDMACPQDVFPAEVTMTQPGNDRHLLFVTYNRKGPLALVGQQTLLGNVDSDNDFSIALGVGAAGQGNCGLLGVSYATGHITVDPLTQRGIGMSGDLVTSYSAGCVAAGQGGAGAAGLTVEFRLPITTLRKN